MHPSSVCLTPEQFKTIVQNVRKGNTLQAAARLARIPWIRVSTVYARGKGIAESFDYDPTDPKFIDRYSVAERHAADFYLEVHKQVSLCEEEWRTHISNAAERDWRAAERLMKYINPTEWDTPPAQRITVESTHVETRNINLNLDKLGVAELEMLDKMLEKIAENTQRDVIDAKESHAILPGQALPTLITTGGGDNSDDFLTSETPRPVGPMKIPRTRG